VRERKFVITASKHEFSELVVGAGESESRKKPEVAEHEEKLPIRSEDFRPAFRSKLRLDTDIPEVSSEQHFTSAAEIAVSTREFLSAQRFSRVFKNVCLSSLLAKSGREAGQERAI
jgi:hypothetical protein